MTDSKPKSKKTDVFLWWALGIALAAFGLRLSLVNLSIFAVYFGPIRDCQAGLLAHQHANQS